MTLVSLEPLGTKTILPAIVIGYELEEHICLSAIQDRAPPWIWHILQQAGGGNMSYPSAFGIIMRLSANTVKAHGDAAALICGFEAMAEDPDMHLLRTKYPLLYTLVNSRGDAYPQAQLAALHAYIAQVFRWPTFESGLEAFLRFAPCLVLETFKGWNILRHRLTDEQLAVRTQVDGIVLIEGTVRDLSFTDHEHLTGRHLFALRQLAETLGISSEPRVFLLWENSD